MFEIAISTLDAHLFLAVKYPQHHQEDSFYILKNYLRTCITKKDDRLCRYAIDILEKINFYQPYNIMLQGLIEIAFIWT